MDRPKPASPLPWSNNDGKRGKKRSIWVAASHNEREDVYGGPSRYGPDRNYVANVTATGSTTKEQAQANSDYIVWAANSTPKLESRIAELEAERDRLRNALDDLLHLCMHASKDAFSNGVTDCSGTIDEGDVRAGAIIDEARKALQPKEQS